MKTGEPMMVRYDTAASADIVWGLGLGCDGVVQLLIEPLDIRETPRHIELLSRCIMRQEPCAIATVFGIHEAHGAPSFARRPGESGVKLGSRLLLPTNGDADIEFQHDELADALMQDTRECLNNNQSAVKVYELAAGKVEVFIEVVEPSVPLVVFGANADAAPVAEFAQKLGWHVTVVDTQARDASRERFPDADAVLLCRPETIATQVSLTARTMALIMTHNYEHDSALFKMLMPSPARYLGMMGPRRRTERIIAEAESAGIIMSDANMHRLHAPVGLDLGAETPEEIALSIVAEIHAVATNHQGGFLKNRTAPIHIAPEKRNSKRAQTIDA
jgi:xanthine/CO dehydrogenase XdhC/CoxF family maturation factor